MSDLDAIKEIEKIIGRELNPCPPDKNIMHPEQHACYLLNSQQQVIGLNIKNLELENCDFLTALTNLMKLDLSSNKLSDINILKSLPNLTNLVLDDNKIRDFSILKNLDNLTVLGLGGICLNSDYTLEINFLRELNKLTWLILRCNNLHDISVLKNITNLTHLYLTANKIDDISVLKFLQNLTILDIFGNDVSDIKVLKDLKNLKDISLGANKVNDISVLKYLSNLTCLQLSGRNHEDYKYTDISILKNLPNLAALDLNTNNLSDISVLENLTKLTHLWLNNNNLNDISVLKALSNLTELGLGENNLSDINVLKSLATLTKLDLNKNEISNISVLKELANLTTIDLRNNQLKLMPEWLLDFNIPIKLENDYKKGIYLENNPLEDPPIEIIQKGNEAIRAYFEQLRKEGFDYIYEAKLILVGEGGAGKTSLANKIKNPDWQLIPETKSESTKGIDILSYQFPYKDKTFRVNIWDFGGQEIYHQTHQFFLSKRSLYSIVVDSRADSPNLDYWFKLVELLSNNSPLLIIKNEKQNRQCTSIQESQLRAEFNNIKDSFPTNLSDNRGLPEIVKALQYYITDLPHIGSPLPKTWVKVREQLEQDSRYYIDLKEYFTLCQANGFEKEADKLQLSEYLHDLGVCLHFQNHPLLLKTLILKPTWATDAVYKVLDNDTVKNQAGHFNEKDLADIWQAEEYNTMRGELLALMQKFKLCYEIPRKPQHYIAPQLLKDKAPQYDWPTNDNLLLRYKYDFMPKGILSQFIVEMHEYIAHNYEWVWKSGVILEKDKTRAEIIEYYGRREIHIRVYGSNKKELLNIVSYELDKINASYERLKDKCKKLIPCNCDNCINEAEPHFYDYAKLKERIAHRKYTIECGNPPYADVEILKLIDDINIPSSENQEAWKKQINITIAGDEVMTGENKTINVSGGTFIEGGVKVKHGDFVSGDKIVNNAQGMSKEEFLQLLQTLKQDLAESKLPADTLEIVSSDIQAVEDQMKKDAPSKSIVSNKLKSVDGMLKDASQVMDTVEKGTDVFNRVVEGVKTLLTVISAASFFL